MPCGDSAATDALRCRQIGAIVLAVGAATAVFSVVDRSLFRPLPYNRGDRLVSVEMILPRLGLSGIMFSGAYRDWRASQNTVDLTSWSRVAECDLGGDLPQRLHCPRAEATFLPTLGVKPYLGRNFTPDEHRQGAEPVALVSYGMWRSKFGGDQTVLGRSDLQPTGWSVSQFNFLDELTARLTEMPGAVATAIADSIPPGPGPRTAPYVALANPGGNATDRCMSGSVRWRYVSGDYFQALGIPIRRGRSFSEGDRTPGISNIVVNETLARRRVGNDDPIGKRLGRHNIIGVAADTRNAGLDRPCGARVLPGAQTYRCGDSRQRR